MYINKLIIIALVGIMTIIIVKALLSTYNVYMHIMYGCRSYNKNLFRQDLFMFKLSLTTNPKMLINKLPIISWQEPVSKLSTWVTVTRNHAKAEKCEGLQRCLINNLFSFLALNWDLAYRLSWQLLIGFSVYHNLLGPLLIYFLTTGNKSASFMVELH